MFYPLLLRPLLFCLNAEEAHTLALQALRVADQLRLLPCLFPNNLHDPVKIMGLTFPNRVGLAAGLDKNGAYINALSRLGFGFLEIGTVTPLPQTGNARPRLFRIAKNKAIINRMGFNNSGVDTLVNHVIHARYQGILGINIGKNATTSVSNAADDYLICLDKVYPFASYVTINISSPNTKGLRQLQHADELGSLLHQLKTRQTSLADQYGHYVPLVVKIAPDLDDEEIGTIARILIKHRIDGVIATNTTLSRQGITDHVLAKEDGGLSGLPLREHSTRVIQRLAQALEHALPIIGVGGIMSADDAKEKLAAGASLIQLYSGLIYQGPGLIGACVKRLADSV